MRIVSGPFRLAVHDVAADAVHVRISITTEYSQLIDFIFTVDPIV